MAVLVNFKICDNAKECGGVAVCPTGALSFDEKKDTLVIDNDKCICCGACETECPIGAIAVAHEEDEYKILKEEIEHDSRTTKDLFVDRYGAAPLSAFFMIQDSVIEEKIKGNQVTLIECYQEESIACLLKSIPIKEITAHLPSDTLFYKVEMHQEALAKYAIEEFPTLLIFKAGKLVGKIGGYYTVDDKENFISKLNDILR